jgi:hypothetical protein
MTRSIALKLAKPGDPYVTGRGQIVEPVERESPEPDVSSKAIDYKEYKPNVRRSLRELPAETGTINGIGAVLLYTLLGVSNVEIAKALSVTLDTVRKVKEHEAYAKCFAMVTDGFISANSELLHARIASYSHDALTMVAKLAKEGKKEETKLRASTDLLDRAGVGPKELLQRGQMNRMDLRIQIVEAGETVDVHINGAGDV